MPPRDWPQRVQDILDLAARIRDSVSGLSFEEFAADDDVKDANVYRVALIGEAANAVPEDIRDRHPEIPWRAVRDMRNVLMHVYFGIDLPTVWDTIQRRVPEIEQQMLDLLRAEGRAGE